MKKYIIVALVSVIATAAFADPGDHIHVFMNIEASATLNFAGTTALTLNQEDDFSTDYVGGLEGADAPILTCNVPVTVSSEVRPSTVGLLMTEDDETRWSVWMLGVSRGTWTPAGSIVSANFDPVVVNATPDDYPISVAVKVTNPDVMAVGQLGNQAVATVYMTVAPR